MYLIQKTRRSINHLVWVPKIHK